MVFNEIKYNSMKNTKNKIFGRFTLILLFNNSNLIINMFLVFRATCNDVE